MKFQFNNDELNWLNSVVNNAIVLAAKHLKDEDGATVFLATLARMKHKFTPNAYFVFLNQKERALVSVMGKKYLEKLETVHSLSDEFNLVKRLVAKVSM